MNERPLWFWCFFCAITMSLGWGLRGSIGGGALGAMIPGALIGLALCILSGREHDAGFVAALAAVGVGFGGQETYGQTVGLIRSPETFGWAFLGFAVKGAVWGLLGGAFIGIGFVRKRLSTSRLVTALILMVIGTWLGWRFVDAPKLVYFSNRLEKPREELWAGLWLGGLLLLVWLRARIPSLFALYGAIGGGVGFAFGAALQPWGTAVWADMPLGWWKAMELTFGALLGIAYALCAWRLRNELRGEGGEHSLRLPLVRSVGMALVSVGLLMIAGERLPLRFGWTIAGALLIALAVRSEALAWHTAITATFAAFMWDMLKKKTIVPEPWVWLVLIVSTAVVCVAVAKHPLARPMFLLLTWTAVANAFRYLIPPVRSAEPSTMLTVFVAFAVLMTLGTRGRSSSRASSASADSGIVSAG